jgi:glycyl-tRNA synthetase beta chain
MMSSRDFLFEIGLEEMPAKVVGEASEQLQGRVEKWLKENRISYSKITPFATPRRLGLIIEDVAEKQEDTREEAKGPAKKIALDEEGNWTKAAQGFARGQGVSKDDFYFKELKGVEYIYVTKYIQGIVTKELLPQVKELVTSMNFPKNMRWGNYDLKFVRPIRWIVALFGQEVIPLEITDIHSGNQTEGHRFLGNKVTIEEPKLYERQLLGEYVIAQTEERKKAIMAQLKTVEEEHQWDIPVDTKLLDEVTHLVEYPTSIFGSFDPEFLSLPEEVLITSMKEHQRYFPVRNQSGELLPHFVTVRNGDIDPNGVVAKGNEKVLRARLADARFFYEEDKKLEISPALSQLEHVVFHEELGSLGDKVRRIREISGELAEWLTFEEDAVADIDRAAEICKFDLVSQMVNEFPELQGRMGEEYAELAGENQVVCKAIFEHYLPRFAGDALPQSKVGAMLSVADKMDSIVGCFAIGIVPTGSQDPYALRRQASGIVHILLHEKWAITLEQLFNIAISTFRNRQLMQKSVEEVKGNLQSFFALRLKNRMQEQGIRYDVMDAVLHDYSIEIHSIFAKAEVLMNQVGEESFKPLVDAFTRVNNIADKIDRKENTIRPEKFEADVEHELYESYIDVKKKVELLTAEKKWQEAYQSLAELKEPIEGFFDGVMVMVEDDLVRYNRLSLLQQISILVGSYADFSQIVFSSRSA